MSFILPSDREYQSVKRIRQGKSRLDPIYDPFVESFRRRYGFPPLAVSVDAIDRPGQPGKTPRLGVVLERSAQYNSFVRAPHSYDSRMQQAIARMFVDALDGTDLPAVFGLPRPRPRSRVQAEHIFVYFADFERVAKWEAYDLVSGPELEAFTSSLGLGDQLWCTQRFAGPPIVFVHTEEQAAVLTASSAPQHWADAYFEITKRHDEFDYLRRTEIAIHVDSKENFDTNYSGNWYYYFK